MKNAKREGYEIVEDVGFCDVCQETHRLIHYVAVNRQTYFQSIRICCKCGSSSYDNEPFELLEN